VELVEQVLEVLECAQHLLQAEVEAEQSYQVRL
jgi:hypothetical protein